MPDNDMRQQADARILNLVDQVRVRPGRPDLPPAEINGMVEEKVNAARGARLRNRFNEPSRSEPSATAGALR
jgi:hypothetical protein